MVNNLNSMISIVLIGAGKLGSRHLQALAKVDINANVFVIASIIAILFKKGGTFLSTAHIRVTLGA